MSALAILPGWSKYMKGALTCRTCFGIYFWFSKYCVIILWLIVNEIETVVLNHFKFVVKKHWLPVWWVLLELILTYLCSATGTCTFAFTSMAYSNPPNNLFVHITYHTFSWNYHVLHKWLHIAPLWLLYCHAIIIYRFITIKCPY